MTILALIVASYIIIAFAIAVLASRAGYHDIVAISLGFTWIITLIFLGIVHLDRLAVREDARR